MSSKFLRGATASALLAAFAVAQAPNDQPAGATLIVGPGITADNNSTSVTDGPLATCGVPSDDLWYYYIPTATGTATLTTCPTAGGGLGNAAGVPGNDTVIGAWTDVAGGPAVQIGCDDDGCTTSPAQLESVLTIPVTAGVGVFVSVSGWGGSPSGGAYQLEITESAVVGPVNDLPAGATLLVGPGAYADDNSTAVVDGPLAACGAPSDDLWYYYIPTGTGSATLTTCPGAGGGAGNANGVPGNDTVIGVWADGGGAPGAAIGCDDDACVTPGFASIVTVPITAGVGLYVSVAGWGGSPSGGTYVLEITEATGPLLTGDDCTVADATAIGPGVYAYNSAGFVLPGPLPGCAIGADPNDYWFAYTATQTGLAIVSNCPTSIAAPGGSAVGVTDTAIAVWDASSCPPTTQLACEDGSPDCGVAQSEAVFAVTSGTTYFVQVQGWNPGGVISGAIAISEVLPPANDECSGALPIFANVPVTGSTSSATTSVPTGSCGAMGTDLWYAFTNPCSGPILINTCGSTYDTAIAVFDACGGVQLGCNDDSGANGPCPGTLQSYLEITGVPQGNTIFIAVGGFAAQSGNFTLTVQCEYTHSWTVPAGPGSIQLENVDGPANALAFSAITLDLLHPGLPVNQTFPNGWFFGVPMGFPELFQQITWPGGLPFTGILDGSGYLFNFVLPAGTTSGLAGLATIWSVGVAFDPLTGFATVNDTTDPTAFPL